MPASESSRRSRARDGRLRDLEMLATVLFFCEIAVKISRSTAAHNASATRAPQRSLMNFIGLTRTAAFFFAFTTNTLPVRINTKNIIAPGVQRAIEFALA